MSSKSIDEKVVEMRFDNKGFESNVQTSIKSLEQLKKGLNLEESAKGLSSLEKTAKSFSLSNMADSVQTVAMKFSMLDVLSLNVLNRIANTAIDTGKKLVNAFAIEPITTGFNEYELKMGSIQTIMASTGESLDVVNKYLDELNTYSDKTIYSFADMTTNIGKFTNAGVKLEDAVLAIKGVSNEAAVSGANAQEASRAMYNFAQALSAGYVKLIDWKSIENANMATVEFKTQLLETATSLGVVTKTADGMYKTLKGNVLDATHNFNDCLQDQWMTTDVLVNTLRNYADETTDIGKKAYAAAQDVKTFSMMMDTLKEAAQSGWAATWQLIVGDYNEAKELFTKLSDTFGKVIDDVSDKRNKLLKDGLGSNFDKLEDKLESIGIKAKDFEEDIKKTAKEFNIPIEEMITQYGSLGAVITKTGNVGKLLIKNTYERIIGANKGLSDSNLEVANSMINLEDVVHRVIMGEFGNGADRVKALTEANYDYAQVQDLVNKVMCGETVNFEQLSDAQLENLGYTRQQVEAYKKLKEEAEKTGTPINKLLENMNKPTGRELLVDSLFNTLKAIGVVCKSVGDAWRDIFPPMTGDKLYSAIEGLHKFSEWLIMSKTSSDNLMRTLRGLFAALDLVLTVTGGIARIAFRTLLTVLKMLDIDVLKTTGDIGDMIVAFRKWLYENNIIAKAIVFLVDKMKVLFEATKDFYDAVKVDPRVQKAVETVSGYFKNLYGDLSEYFSGGLDIIKEWYDRVNAMDNITLDNVKSALKDFNENVIGYFFNFDGKFETSKNLFNNFKEFVVGVLDKVISSLKEVYQEASPYLKKITDFFRKYVNIWSALSIASVVGIIKMVGAIGDLKDSLISPIIHLNDVLKSFSKVLKSVALKEKMKAMKEFAEAILILAAALFVLSKIPADKMTEVLKTLGALMIGMVALFGVMQALSNLAGGAKATISITALAAAVYILAKTMLQLDGINSDNAIRNLTTIGLMAGALAGLGALMSKFAGPFSTKSATTVLALAVSIGILVSCLKSLSKMDTSSLVVSMTALITMLVSLGIVSALLTKLGGTSGLMGILSIALGLKVFVSAIKDIIKLDPDKLADGLASIMIIINLFTKVMVASILAGKNAAKAGLMIIEISIAMMLMVGVIKQLSKLDSSTIDSAIDTINTLLVGFSIVIASSRLAGENAKKAGKMIISVTVALGLITGVIWLLTKMDDSKVDHAIKCIMKLEAMFGLLMFASWFTSSSNETTITALNKLIVGVAALAISLAILSNVDQNKLTAAAGALSVTMLALSASMILMSGAEANIKSIATMVLVVSLLTSLLTILAELPVENSLGNATALGTMMLALSASLKMVSKCNDIGAGTIYALAGLTLIMTALAVLMKVIDLLDVSVSSETLVQLCAMLINLSLVAKILSSFKADAKNVGMGVIAMGEIIGGITVLATIIGAIMEVVPGARTALDTGLDVLIELFGAIGEMFGTLIGKFLGGLTAGLPDIGNNLTGFMTNIQGFLDMASGIDEGPLTGIGYLVDTILKLTAAELLDRIASFVGGGKSMDKFCSDLIIFASGLIGFSNVIKESNIDADTTEKVAKCGSMLAELEKSLPRQGGWIQKVAGEKDLGEFGKRVSAFGDAMKLFYESIAGLEVDTTKAEDLAKAGEALAALEKATEPMGGAADKLAGVKDLEKFGGRVKKFGDAMVIFFDSVKDLKVDTTKAEDLATAGDALAKLEKNTEAVGGLADKLAGVKDIGAFGGRLELFGTSMSTFFDTIKDLNVDTDKAESLAAAGESLSNLERHLPKTDGEFFKFFTGEPGTLDKFGKNIAAFGMGIMNFYVYTKSIDTNILSKTAVTAQMLIDLDKAVSTIDLGIHTLSDIGEDLVFFGQKFNEFYEQVKSINTAQVSGVIAQMKRMTELAQASTGANGDGLNSMANSFQNVANACIATTADTISGGIDNVTSAIHQTLTTVASSMNDGLNNVLKTIKDKDKTFTLYGKNLILELANGMRNKISSVRNTASNIGQSAVNAINSYRSQFYSAGIYLVDGFANGIDSRTWYSTAKSKRMASLAAEAAEKELDEHSPSKRFFKIGAYGGEGFANGIDSMSKMVEASSVDMARTALDETNNVIAAIVSCISDNMDLTPTIAPVLDTSNIRDGVTSINSLLSNSAFGMNTNIDSVRSMMSIRQNGTNRELLGAIDKLGKQMSNIQSNSYTINGITYDNGSEVADAIETLVRATRIERRA